MNVLNNLRIIKLDDQGRGITYVNDLITFIPNTLTDEIVNIKIIKTTKKYNIGTVINYIKISTKRIEVKCPYYDQCGGCNLLHLDYNETIQYKKDKIKSILKKFSNIEQDIAFIPNTNDLNYRNKIDLKIINNNWGYYNNNTHDFISINNCLLASKCINKLIKHKDLFNINNGSIIIRDNELEELLISITTQDSINIDIDKLESIFNIKGIIVNDKVLFGDSYIIEEINYKKFKVNYNSFFQVNNNISSEIIKILDKECTGKNILDLYCGVGFLGQSLNKKNNKIYGIEINKDSIENAKYNALINNIDNTYYYVDNSNKMNNHINDNIDSIIIDPPRNGLDKKTINDIINYSSNQLIYISCNPITLSRDLNILKEHYYIKKIYALDMFSYTYHVECVCVLNRR